MLGDEKAPPARRTLPGDASALDGEIHLAQLDRSRVRLAARHAELAAARLLGAGRAGAVAANADDEGVRLTEEAEKLVAGGVVAPGRPSSHEVTLH